MENLQTKNFKESNQIRKNDFEFWAERVDGEL
jgi:hypothetical protein